LAAKRKARVQGNWYRVDLHLHTPGSSDYQEHDVTYIDILHKAESRGLDIIAFTDHNTIAGYAGMWQEIEGLAYLQRLGRAEPDELRRLSEYRRLLDKILVLPGFEFTATFGFHVLGIFSPQTPIRQLEHLLLTLHVPPEALDKGNSEVGASSDVLTAYQVIDENGGICIAAHVNSAHGVAMRGFDFGGQTKIAFTQDRHLHALEATDLGRRVRGSTQRFFDGTKAEYPRQMRIVQGSDAHRLNALPDKTGKQTSANLGVGDRVTEVLLPERSFEALHELFLGSDFSRSRPYTAKAVEVDYIQAARDEGPSLIQSFHETMSGHGGRLYNVIADVCAFANTNGGTIYVGISPDKKKEPTGIENPQEAIDLLQQEISTTMTPNPDVDIDVQESQAKTIIRIQVPSGAERPYAINGNKIYVRDGTETTLAVRDEIVNLVRQGLNMSQERLSERPTPVQTQTPAEITLAAPSSELTLEPATNGGSYSPSGEADGQHEIGPPRAGVEIVEVEQKGKAKHYTLRDLRNGNVVKNVTRSSARRLWHYALTQAESNPVRLDKVQWMGEIGLWRRYRKGGETRYDLVQREDGKMRTYYGVTENGIHGPWQAFLEPEGEVNGDVN